VIQCVNFTQKARVSRMNGRGPFKNTSILALFCVGMDNAFVLAFTVVLVQDGVASLSWQ
jgi:hypothetical protein